MKIIGMDGLTTDRVNHELQHGARFVVLGRDVTQELISAFNSGPGAT